ncbi:hypothetical protein HDV04_002878 [Boothiomyces sp. JEL0838]|nr:hypothetical protein HDV04_002878 [Boothiomyces sp. JEL0838]
MAVTSLCFIGLATLIFMYGIYKYGKSDFWILNIAMMVPLIVICADSILALSMHNAPSILTIINAQGILHCISLFSVPKSDETDSIPSPVISQKYIQSRKDQMDQIEADRYLQHLGKDETIVEMNVKEPNNSQFFFNDQNTFDTLRVNTMKSSKTLVNHRFVPITKGLSLDSGVVYFENQNANPRLSRGQSLDSRIPDLETII